MMIHHCMQLLEKVTLSVVQVLLSEMGADVQARNKRKNATLNVAALNGHSNNNYSDSSYGAVLM